MPTQYDIFISYKRKSLATANNLYYRLTTRGYSTFFDLEEMGRDNFNMQLLNYIESAKDVFVILEEGSLDASKREDWEKDWFCHEIAFALEKKKNIIPILIGGYQMPSEDFFPDKLKELSLKNAPEFNFSFFEAYLDKLTEKEYLLSKPNIQDKATSVFKFYSNENCQVFKEGKLVCSLEGMSDEPYYLPVPRKGDYRFKAVNLVTADKQTIKEHIEADEEKEIEIEWECHLPLKPDQEWPEQIPITGDNYLVDLGYAKFNMIRVQGGELLLGATPEVTCSKEVKIVKIPSIYRPRKRFSEGLMLVENPEHKFGYLNDSLEEVIPCQYCNGGAFANGIAPVYNNEKWGAIDTRGNIVHPFQYGNMYSIPNYKPVSRPKNEPFFIKDGRVIDKWNNEYNFFHGIPLLANNNDIYYLDQGVITCYTLERDLKGIWHDTIKFKKEGFTKRNGFRKEGFYQFYNHLAIICKNEKYGIINLSLDEIVPCEFEQICDFDLDSENTVACDSKGNFYHIKVKKK